MGGMYKKFKTDQNAEKNGIVLDYTEFRVTIARAGGANKKFKRKLEEAMRPHQRALQTNNMENEMAETVLKGVYARSVVLDWEVKVDDEFVPGIESPDGGDILPVTPENILQVFENLDDLYTDIRDQAQNASLFRSALREEAAKN